MPPMNESPIIGTKLNNGLVSTMVHTVSTVRTSRGIIPFLALDSLFLSERIAPGYGKLGKQVVGFMMWAVDPADDSCWLGGILIDQSYQRKGYGRQAVQGAISMLAKEYGYENFALSYQPTNLIAKHLYNSLGFSETDEWEGDEIVARLSLAV